MDSLAAHSLSRRTGYVLIKLGDVVTAGAEAKLQPLGLTGRQFDLMASVAADGSLSQRDIARLLGLDPNIVGDLIDDLEERDLVTRARSDQDRRRHVLTLTASGEELLQAAATAATAGEEDLLAGLTSDEARMLHELATRVLAPHWPVAPAIEPGSSLPGARGPQAVT